MVSIGEMISKQFKICMEVHYGIDYLGSWHNNRCFLICSDDGCYYRWYLYDFFTELFVFKTYKDVEKYFNDL